MINALNKTDITVRGRGEGYKMDLIYTFSKKVKLDDQHAEQNLNYMRVGLVMTVLEINHFKNVKKVYKRSYKVKEKGTNIPQTIVNGMQISSIILLGLVLMSFKN